MIYSMDITTLRIPGRGATPQAKWQFLAVKRLTLKLSQEELARLCGVSQSQISDWERGKYMPSMPYMSQIAKALNVGIGELAEQADIFFSNNIA